jgi:hypothetical protein
MPEVESPIPVLPKLDLAEVEPSAVPKAPPKLRAVNKTAEVSGSL